MTTSMSLQPTNREKIKAWSVHIFTATGVLWGFLGLLAVINEQWKLAFFWMIVATFVDGIDGVFARRFRVKRVLPNFDGALLDNIIDYFTYTILPALLLYYAPGILPPEAALFTAAAIILSSAYQFCQTDAKTPDNYFKGFPSYWNIVAFYLLVLGLHPWVNVTIIITLAILVFIPIKYAYPTRMSHYQKLTLVLGAIWAIMFIMLWYQLPEPNQLLAIASLFYVVYYVFISFYMQRPRANRAA
jgi:phosphatidylcholine synthase